MSQPRGKMASGWQAPGERSRCHGLLRILLVGAIAAQAAYSQAVPSGITASEARATLNTYCISCHNQRLRRGELVLDPLDVERVGGNAEIWEKVIRKLRAGAMPPAGLPRPSQAGYKSLVGYMESTVDREAAAHPNPGRPVVHRLNRAEYANAVRDLLMLDTSAIDIPSLLPVDDAGYGFDNIGDVLSVSPVLLERYMAAARRIARLAIGAEIPSRPEPQTYEAPRYLRQDEGQLDDDAPFGSRGGMTINHYFSHDGQYLLQVRLKRTLEDPRIIGSFATPQQIEVRIDGERRQVFMIDNERAQAEKIAVDAGLNLRAEMRAGLHRISATFVDNVPEHEGTLWARVAQLTPGDSIQIHEETPGIGRIVIEGPFAATSPGDTPSRRSVFVCHPTAKAEEQRCAQQILSKLARRAYRRPVTGTEIDDLLGLYNKGASGPSPFESGIEMALRGMLVSPSFLFRVEGDAPSAGPNKANRVTDLELASRLSFFLWSSIPDEELLKVAESGKLSAPAELERQVRRLLADKRASSLVTNFADQWLFLRNVDQLQPNRQTFPDFDENLRIALRRETELLFESVVQEDRSVLDLLNADYTFLNERLARHYGIPNVHGNHFRRVAVTDENRRGLLGQGSILALTSYPHRTSPTLRGKWLLENLLGMGPPPPPPNVPALDEDSKVAKVQTMRERMEQHRKNPACASCHAQMDPLGFALDNFDALGAWRSTTESGTPIDASGVLPDGTRFNGPAALRKILLDRHDQFVQVLTEKLLTYALGRGVEYYDMPVVRSIAREAAQDKYRWSSFVLSIVKSSPFQMRRTQS